MRRLSPRQEARCQPAFSPMTGALSLSKRGLSKRGLSKRGLSKRGLSKRGLSKCYPLPVRTPPVSTIDPLTGVCARTLLGERLQEEVGRSSRYHLHFALFMLDLDHFKSVNDAFGHRRGDQVLIEVAQRLRRVVREMDEVYRYGGDEFVILLPHTDLEQAAVVAARLLREVGNIPIAGDPPINVSLSIGVAIFPDDAATAEVLFEVADQRHYQAKQQGRGRAVLRDQARPESPFLTAPSRLIERDDAVRALEQFLTDLPTKKRGLLQISGAAGMGRSRLLDETRKSARLRGYGIFTFQGNPALKSRWMGALIEAQRHWENWPVILTQKEALSEALHDWLLSKGRQGLVITIDAAQEIDRHSLDTIGYLLRSAQFGQLAAVYTWTEERIGSKGSERSFPSKERSNTVAHLWGDFPLKSTIKLSPLSAGGVQVWLRHSLKWEAPAEFTSWLHKETGGHPAMIHRGLLWLINQNILHNETEEAASSAALSVSSEPGWKLNSSYPEIHLAQRLPTRAVAPTNLPAHLPTFIGRENEIEYLKQSLCEQRLTTVVGPGGLGKTSLARQAAAECLEENNEYGEDQYYFVDGVFFIPLTTLTAPQNTNGDIILTAVADAIGIEHSLTQNMREQMFERLCKMNTLVVLDNFEHLLEEAPVLSEIIECAPRVHFLTTSREPLNLPEESLVELGGLPFPEENSTEESSAYSAVQLFLHIARQITPDFNPGGEETEAMVRICQLVEGMPLGIELAASTVSMFTCQQIVAEVEQNLTFLSSTSPELSLRHRSMRAIFDSFWGLLSDWERGVLAGLSVFRGGFTFNAAQAVAGASPFFIDALAKKLFLHRLPQRRYTMHSLLNQYAAEKLQAQPEAASKSQKQHCDYFINLLQTNEAQLQNGQSPEVFNRIAVEVDNLRAAWEWLAARDDLQRMEKILPGLKSFLDNRGWFREMLRILYAAKEKLIQGCQADFSDSPRTRSLVRVLTDLGESHYHLGSYAAGRQELELALAILTPLDLPAETATVIQQLANIVRSTGDYASAIHLLQQGLPLAQKTGDLTLEVNLENSLGVALFLQSSYQEAYSVFEASLEISRRLKDSAMIARALNNLGDTAYELHDYAHARSFLTESLVIFADRSFPTLQAEIAGTLAKISCAEGNFGEASSYLIEALEQVAKIDAIPLEVELLLKTAAMWEMQGDWQRALDLARVIQQQHDVRRDTLLRANQLVTHLQENSQMNGKLLSLNNPWTSASLQKVTDEVLAYLEEVNQSLW